MTEGIFTTVEYGRATPSDRLVRFLAGPPGWIFLSLSLVTAVGFLYADSEDLLFLILLFMFAGFILVIAWLTRIIVNVLERQSTKSWRWFVTPTLAVATVILMCAGVPLQARFAISREALTKLAVQELAKPGGNRANGFGPVVTAGGLDVQVWHVDNVAGRVDFVLPNAGLVDLVGFSYSPNSVPANDSQAQYRSIGNGWYQWKWTY